MFLSLFAILANHSLLSLATAPPQHAVYKNTVKLPFIGEQTVQISILSNCTGRLELRGALQIDEPVTFTMYPSGEFDFSLTDRTIQLLRRFRTRLMEASYNPNTDEASVTVQPPLPISIHIRLIRATIWRLCGNATTSQKKKIHPNLDLAVIAAENGRL